jgi:hypothetical protein
LFDLNGSTMPTGNTCIEFTLGHPSPLYLPAAKKTHLPPYFVDKLATAGRSLAYVVSTDPDAGLVNLIPPDSPGVVTLALAAILDEQPLETIDGMDAAGHRVRVAFPKDEPETRLVVEGNAETARVQQYGGPLVAKLAKGFSS